MFPRFLYIYHFSDAPALSRDDALAAAPSDPNGTDSPDVNDEGDQWDEEALAASLTRKGAVTATSNTTELLDMKASRSEQGNIAEKLRVEETKAKLKAAKEGMEKEAQRLKEEKEKKESGKQEASSGNKSGNPRFGAAAVGMAGGKSWVPPHMRSGGGMMAARMGMGPIGTSTKVDTQDENLFPDLKAADAIMEQKKAQQPAFKAPKKTPVGGGATWGSRPKIALAPPKKVEEPPKPAEPEPEPEVQPEEPKPAASAAAPAAAPIKPKKKKKKDLSTFKPTA
jgi:hypothetical protein